MLTKEKIKKAIDLLPENVAVDELMDRIILLDKIEQGLNDVEDGNTYTTEQVENKLNKWIWKTLANIFRKILQDMQK